MKLVGVDVEVEVASEGANAAPSYSYAAITAYLESGSYPLSADKKEVWPS